MGFGQYTNSSVGRRTKDDLLDSCDRNLTKAKFWGHNRLVVTYPDRVEYRLHDTAVVTVRDTDIVIDDGGHHTITTSAAISQALKLATGKPAGYWRNRKGQGVVHFGEREAVGYLPITIQV